MSRGDRVGDTSEYDREFEDEAYENSDWNVCSEWLIILRAGVYDFLHELAEIARRCASRFRFADASPYASHVVSVEHQGRSWLLRWVRSKVGCR